MKTVFSTLAVGLVSATSGFAATLAPVSYDMPNGEEYTSYSGYEYFDETYNGNGDTTVSRATLTGGLGDLTDGVIGTATWKPTNFFTTPAERAALQASMRPYVGWFVQESKGAPYAIDITFHFGRVVQVDQVNIHGLMGNLDRSSNSEPTMPDYFRISTGSGSAQIDRSDVPLATRTYKETVQTGGLSGESFTLSMGFNYDPSDFYSGRDFIFVSEVEFIAPAPVPLPAGGLLMLSGLGAIAAASRRRKRAGAA